MMRKGRRVPSALTAIIALLALVLVTPLAGAQSAPVLESAELRLWPEYDDPGLLVIFGGEFAEGATFPLTVAIPVAAEARNVQATYEDAAGSLLNRPFEITDGNLTYELPSAAFHIEYYVDRAPSSNERSISYTFQAPYAINSLRVSVQQPARSTDFSLTPAAESQQQGTDGLTYHVINRTGVAAGEQLQITINYTKTDTDLSAPLLSVAQGGGTTDQAAAVSPIAQTTSLATLLPWLLIGLGVVLLAAIVAYWLLSQRRAAALPVEAPAAPERRVRAKGYGPGPQRVVTARPETGGPAFCTNCGNALESNDRFCSQCGAARRG